MVWKPWLASEAKNSPAGSVSGSPSPARYSPESESLIYESLASLLQGRAALIATHRLSTIQGADLILVMHQGRSAERGAHDELMKLGGRYRNMVGDQESGDALIPAETTA